MVYTATRASTFLCKTKSRPFQLRRLARCLLLLLSHFTNRSFGNLLSVIARLFVYIFHLGVRSLMRQVSFFAVCRRHGAAARALPR